MVERVAEMAEELSSHLARIAKNRDAKISQPNNMSQMSTTPNITMENFLAVIIIIIIIIST